MKVLQINSVCGYGSTGRIVVDLYNVLKENGHECKIAYGRGKAQENIDTIKIGNKFDIYWQIILSRLVDKHGCGSKRATKKLIKQIDTYNPDIIHLHNIHGYYINMEILFNYLAKKNKNVIWTLHDCWAFTGHCAYFTYPKCDKWKEECRRCIRKKGYPTTWLKSNSSKNYLLKKKLFTSVKNVTIITPSEWLKYLVMESFLGKYRIEVINNGIDITKFRRIENKEIYTKYGIPKNKKIILGVASKWDERKGLDAFIQLSKIIDESKIIVLVGLTQKEMQKLRESKNIIGIARTESIEELASLYSIATCFANPTLEDNFPTTNIEAIACGTPVITYNTGGSIEAVNQKTGLIVDSNTVEELNEKINLICKMKFECEQEAYKYEKEQAYMQYIQIYEEILNKN